MYTIKQSTTLTLPFFCHDANGDAVLGLTNASFTKRISKGSAAFGAMTVTITEMENGWYSIPLTATHSDTLGLLTILFTNAGAKQVNLQWRVEANLADDLSVSIATAQADLDIITDSDGVVISATTANQIADAILNRDMSSVSDTNARTMLNALRILRNKWSVSGTTLTVTKEDDSTSAWTATVGTDAAADPVISSDPA